jgi:hypothetical protein
LRQVQAARLRARATRGALLRAFLGSVFLIGALAHARSPQRHEESAIAWMAGLLILSALNVGLGLRALARLRRRSARLWIAGTAAWAVLSVSLVAFLLRG